MHLYGSTTNEALTINPGEGAAVVAIGKRPTDGHALVGCMTEFWPRTGQTNPVITTLVPGGASQVFKVKIDGDIYTTLQSASVVGLTVKGATSQTANLQEWQNSSGTVLASVNKNGVITGATRATFTSSTNACTYDYVTSRTQSIVLTESTTLTISNPVDGVPAVLFIEQGGSGSYTVTWPGTVLWAGGSAPTLSTTVGKVDMITFVYHSGNSKYYATAAIGF